MTTKTVDSALAEVEAALPEGAYIHRVAASPDSQGRWSALIEAHRWYAEGVPSAHWMSRVAAPFASPTDALFAAAMSLAEQLRLAPDGQ